MRLKNIVALLKETWTEFQEDEAGQLGAALAYYAVFSMFPLLILLLAGLGFVLRYWDEAIDVQRALLRVVSQNFSPQLGRMFSEMLDTVKEQASTATGIGLVTLLLGASGVFQQLDQAFNKIWKAPQQPAAAGIVASIMMMLRQKLFSFGMVITVGFLLLVSLALTGLSQALLGALNDLPVIGGVFGFLIGLLVTMALNTLIFALLFKYLPNTDVRWGDVWVGALLTSVIWEIAKRLLALYVERSSYVSAYGAVGTILVVMVWVYFSSQVLFLGAEFTEVYSRRHGSRVGVPAPDARVQPEVAVAKTAQMPQQASSTGKVVAATGAGLLIGAIGGLIATLAAIVIAVRRATSSIAGRIKRLSP